MDTAAIIHHSREMRVKIPLSLFATTPSAPEVKQDAISTATIHGEGQRVQNSGEGKVRSDRVWRDLQFHHYSDIVVHFKTKKFLHPKKRPSQVTIGSSTRKV